MYIIQRQRLRSHTVVQTNSLAQGVDELIDLRLKLARRVLLAAEATIPLGLPSVFRSSFRRSLASVRTRCSHLCRIRPCRIHLYRHCSCCNQLRHTRHIRDRDRSAASQIVLSGNDVLGHKGRKCRNLCYHNRRSHLFHRVHDGSCVPIRTCFRRERDNRIHPYRNRLFRSCYVHIPSQRLYHTRNHLSDDRDSQGGRNAFRNPCFHNIHPTSPGNRTTSARSNRCRTDSRASTRRPRCSASGRRHDRPRLALGRHWTKENQRSPRERGC